MTPALLNGARGERAYGRPSPQLAGRWSGSPRRSEPVETVTLGKVGDFLEIDFRRLFVWLRRGLLASIVLGLVGGVLGGAYAILSKPKYTVSTGHPHRSLESFRSVPTDLYAQPAQADNQLRTAGAASCGC